MDHKGTQRIETKRLVLRRFRTDDAEAMYRNWACDSEVTKYLTWSPHANAQATAELLRSWVAAYRYEDCYQWAIVLKEEGDEPVGSISAVFLRNDISMVHIGYCIGQNWWNRGIMTEALEAVIAFFFDEVKANRIESRHDTENPRSGMVMRKCGMRYEGTMRSADRNNRGVCDVCCYALLKEDYDRNKEQKKAEGGKKDGN